MSPRPRKEATASKWWPYSIRDSSEPNAEPHPPSSHLPRRPDRSHKGPRILSPQMRNSLSPRFFPAFTSSIYSSHVPSPPTHTPQLLTRHKCPAVPSNWPSSISHSSELLHRLGATPSKPHVLSDTWIPHFVCVSLPHAPRAPLPVSTMSSWAVHPTPSLPPYGPRSLPSFCEALTSLHSPVFFVPETSGPRTLFPSPSHVGQTCASTAAFQPVATCFSNTPGHGLRRDERGSGTLVRMSLASRTTNRWQGPFP